jgi:hypothetical protein
VAPPTVKILPGTILRIEFHEVLSVEDINAFIRFCEPQFIARQGTKDRLVSVSNIDKIKPQSAEARRALAKGLAGLAERYPGVGVGEAVIATSAVARALVTGFWWWRSAQDGVKRQCFEHEAAAMEWANTVLEETQGRVTR